VISTNDVSSAAVGEAAFSPTNLPESKIAMMNAMKTGDIPSLQTLISSGESLDIDERHQVDYSGTESSKSYYERKEYTRSYINTDTRLFQLSRAYAPWKMAVLSYNPDVIKCLIEKGVDVNRVITLHYDYDPQRHTAIHYLSSITDKDDVYQQARLTEPHIRKLIEMFLDCDKLDLSKENGEGFSYSTLYNDFSSERGYTKRLLKRGAEIFLTTRMMMGCL